METAVRLSPSVVSTWDPKGDIIIKEGDADRNLFKFYIVEEGEARAYVHEDGEDVLMSHLRPGENERNHTTRTERGALGNAIVSLLFFARIRPAVLACKYMLFFLLPELLELRISGWAR